MRTKIITLTSASALAVFAVAPAGAIQTAPGIGAIDSHIVQVQENRMGRGGSGGPSIGRQGGPGGPGGPGLSAGVRGDAGGPSISNRGPSGGDRSGPSINRSGPSFGAHSRGDGPSLSGRSRVQHDGKRDRHVGRHSSGKWDGRLSRRGWSRDRRHAFYGGVLIGVPFGYSVAVSNPCYDWALGPQGWAYYWNYYRCPV